MRGGRRARGRRRRGLGLRRARRRRRGRRVRRSGGAFGVEVARDEELPVPRLRVVPEPNFLRPITLRGEIATVTVRRNPKDVDNFEQR